MNKKYSILTFFAIFCVVLGFIALGLTVHLLCSDGKVSWLTPLNLDEASKIGDFVGGFIGIFWTIAGIILLFITLRLQSDEFGETRKAITKQQFETTFFNMLNVLGNIRDQIKFKENETEMILESQEFIHFAVNSLKNEYSERLSSNPNLKEELTAIEEKIDNLEQITDLEFANLQESINSIYLSFYDNFHSELGHYFRYIFNLLKFTINSRADDDDESLYINLIQAQLSNDELALIFYNALSEKGQNKKKIAQMYLWLEKYSFLGNLDVKSLIKKSHHEMYKTTIFKFLNIDEIEFKNKNLSE